MSVDWATFLKEHSNPNTPPPVRGIGRFFGWNQPPKPPEPLVDPNDKSLYLDRLNQELRYKVAMGEITPEIAKKIYTVAVNTPDESFFIEAPFIEDIFGKYNPKTNEFKIMPDYEWDIRSNEHLNTLQDYLDKQYKKQVAAQKANAPQAPEEEVARVNAENEKNRIEAEQATQTATEAAQSKYSFAKQEAAAFLKNQAENLVASQRAKEASLQPNDVVLEQAQSAQQRANQYQQFELQRQRRLASLDTNADWIKRWFTEHEANPYTPQEPTNLGRITAVNAELQKWKDIAQNYPNAPAGNGQTWGEIAAQSQASIVNMLEGLKNAPPDTSFTPRPVAPPATPEWLANLVPELRQGQPIRRDVTLPMPSGQTWKALDPSIQQRYGGFTDWAGMGNLEDIQKRIQLVQPYTPANNFRFAPARQ